MDQELNKEEKKTSEVTKQPREKIRRTTSQDTVTSYAEMGESSQLTDTIDAVWNLSSSSENNFISNDDFLRYQEGQEKLKHIQRVYTSLRKKITTTEKEAAELKVALEKETISNQSLKNKSASASKLTESFNQHINYMNDTLIRTRESAKNLEEMYENDIVKLLNDKKKLSKQFDELNQTHQGEDEKYNEEVKQIQLEIAKIKSKNAASEDKLMKLNIKASKVKEELAISVQTTANMKITQDGLKSRVEELKHSLNEQEQKRLDMINNFPETDKIKEIKQCYAEKLSLANEELNKAKSLVNNMQKELEEDLEKCKKQEKICEDLDKNVEKISSEITQFKNQTDEANLELQQVNEENLNTKKKIDEKKHDLSVLKDKLASETIEKNNLADQVSSLKTAIETKKEENKELKKKLEGKITELTEIEQSKTYSDKYLNEFQTAEEPKVVELQNKLDTQKEHREKALVENEELKADKQKLERDHEKYLTEQADRYSACSANLQKQMTLNNKLADEKTEIQNSLASSETEYNNFKAQIAKDKEDFENKLKKAQEVLSKKIESENQLMEQKNQLTAQIKKLEDECKELEKTFGNVPVLSRSQSNIELGVQEPIKLTFSSSQHEINSTKEQQRSQTLKLSPIPGIPSQSLGKKSIPLILSSDSDSDDDDDDTKKQETHDRVDGLLKTLRISQTPPSSQEKSSKVTPSPGTAKRSLFSGKHENS